MKENYMLLTMNNVVKKIADKIILDDVSVSFEAGNIISIIGESGVGKSTFLRILSGLESINSGNITLDGILLRADKKSNEVGLVFQHFNLFSHLNVLENIVLPQVLVKKIDYDQAVFNAYDLLEKYHLINFKNSRIEQLSGGQKQRLAIARTEAMQPKIFCLDEPFSALDKKLVYELIDILNQLKNKGFIIILTTHNIEVLPHLQGITYVLEKGKVLYKKN